MAALGKDLVFNPATDQIGALREISPGVWGEGYCPAPFDATTPLADVAALTAAARGLSMGLADIPTAPITQAQAAGTNMDKVAVSAASLAHEFTSKLLDPTSQGLRNAGGRNGFAFADKKYSMDGVAVSNITDNAAHVVLNHSDLSDRVLQAPSYGGQVLLITRGVYGAPDYSNPIVIKADVGVGIIGNAGWKSGTRRIIDQSRYDAVNFPDNGFRVNELLLRSGEAALLYAYDTTIWNVIATTQQPYSSAYTKEDNSGNLTYHMSQFVTSGGTAYPYLFTIPALNPSDLVITQSLVSTTTTPPGTPFLTGLSATGVNVIVDGSAGVMHHMTVANVIPSTPLA